VLDKETLRQLTTGKLRKLAGGVRAGSACTTKAS
jgi:hypothetical protein